MPTGYHDIKLILFMMLSKMDYNIFIAFQEWEKGGDNAKRIDEFLF